MTPAAGEVVGVLVAFSVAKKVAFYGVARLYGFPRIYRKAVKLQRTLGAPEEAQRSFRMTLQRTMRLPNVAADRWRAAWGNARASGAKAAANAKKKPQILNKNK